ncbi:MAG: hypothetical protein ACRD1R_03120 [Acidobacteriota bacterium]
MRTALALASMFVVAISSAGAVTVRPVNLFEMVEAAENVFLGQCVAVESDLDEVTGLPILQYTFEVLRGLKGVSKGETVTFRQIDSRHGLGLSLPQFRLGEKSLLFLHAASRLGLTSPVGLEQGAFQVVNTTEHGLGVINAVMNRNLLINTGKGRLENSILTAQETRTMREQRPIPLEAFQEIVRKIDLSHRGSGPGLK